MFRVVGVEREEGRKSTILDGGQAGGQATLHRDPHTRQSGPRQAMCEWAVSGHQIPPVCRVVQMFQAPPAKQTDNCCPRHLLTQQGQIKEEKWRLGLSESG